MKAKVINGKLICQGKKNIKVVNLTDIQLIALNKQEVKEFECKFDSTGKEEFENILFYQTNNVLIKRIKNCNIPFLFMKNKGYNKIEIKEILEEEKVATVKSFTVDNKYNVYRCTSKDGFVICDNNVYDMRGNFVIRLNEKTVGEIENYANIIEEYVIYTKKSSYDHTQDIADSYNLVD